MLISRGTALVWTGAVALLIALPATPLTPPAMRPAQIILFRHAEEPSDPDDPHLSRQGVKRAQRLVGFFTSDPTMTRFGPPVALFANRPTQDGDGQRSQETVTPTARRLRLAVQTPFIGKRYADLARLILGRPEYAGKTLIVCWTHSNIPELAAAFGVTPRPDKWKDDLYDRAYLITFPGGTARLSTVDLP